MGRYIFAFLIILCAVKLFFFTDEAFTMPSSEDAAVEDIVQLAIALPSAVRPIDCMP